MPIYEYQCEKCEGTFEAIQKFSDDPLTECRLCEDGKVRKLVSAPAFRLKGSGWYETDFKKDKDRQKNLVKSDGDGGKSASEGTSSSKGDASGASKSDSSGSGSAKSSKSSDAA